MSLRTSISQDPGPIYLDPSKLSASVSASAATASEATSTSSGSHLVAVDELLLLVVVVGRGGHDQVVAGGVAKLEKPVVRSSVGRSKSSFF